MYGLKVQVSSKSLLGSAGLLSIHHTNHGFSQGQLILGEAMI